MPRTFADKGRFVAGLAGLAMVSVVISALLWAVVAPLAFGWSPVAVMSGSMEPLIDTGDMVFIAPTDGHDLEPGTVIVFSDDSVVGRVTHRIVDVDADGNYVTRGDASGRVDSTPVPPGAVEGVGKMVVPALGLPLVWVDEGRWSALLAAAVIITLSAWSSRWALLGRFDPWRRIAVVPPPPGEVRRQTRRVPVVVGIVLGLVVAVGVTTAQSRAAFGSRTGNLGNVALTDTLDPPTAVIATDGVTISVDWTATPDTYATGHVVYRSSTPGGPYTAVGMIAPRTVVHYEESPPPGTYYYVVRAFFGNWESVDSNEDSAVAPAADDYDAVPPGSDNCPTTFNVDQFDTDGDGIGDACDSSPTVASSGVFTTNGQSLGSSDSTAVEFGDVDGDGDLDAFVANFGAANAVWFNDGRGTFADSGQTLGSFDSSDISLGDLDGDGDLDAFVANKAADRVWINNGAGLFSDSGQALGAADSRGVDLGDVDGDGDLDAFVVHKGGSNAVWTNNGAGVFTDSGQALGAADSRDVALGDLDGDGDLDAFIAHKNADAVWTNNGSGIFADSGQTLGLADSNGVGLGDVDGDGDLDAFVATATANAVWTNNGAGAFTDSGQALGSAISSGVALGDLDGDGDVDATIANNGSVDTVWTNNGTGTFTDSGQTLGSADGRDVALGDLDGDGDLDAYFANFAGANTVWVNDVGPAVALANSWQTGLTHVAGAGSDRMLVFVATNEQQSLVAPSLTGVTYGGQPLTFVMADEVANGCCNARSEVWVLDEAGVAAASGTALAPTWSSAPHTPLYSHIVYANVDQAAPFGAQTTASVIGDTPNPVPMPLVVTSAGDMVVAVAVAGEAGSYTAQNGFTLGVDQSTTTGGTTASGTAQKVATGADETVSMLFNPAAPPWTNRQVALALVLHAAP